MLRLRSALLVGLLTLAACTTTSAPVQLGADGKPLPQVYKIRDRDIAKIQYRVLDSVNSLRAASGAPAVTLDARLNAAAATHARDMHVQNRPWHFGSDGSSPILRIARVGYTGLLIGENISETYETELETLSAWMAQDDTRNIILDKRATDLGFDWYQDNTGKLWWVMILGSATGVPQTPEALVFVQSIPAER